MGILDRFEKGLENVVNGAFAKAFRSQVEPVELAGALRREADNKAAVVSRGRTPPPLCTGTEVRQANWNAAFALFATVAVDRRHM